MSWDSYKSVLFVREFRLESALTRWCYEQRGDVTSCERFAVLVCAILSVTERREGIEFSISSLRDFLVAFSLVPR